MKANMTVTIQFDSMPDGSLRMRSIPPLSELLQLADASITSLTQAELYALSALRGVRDMQEKLDVLGNAVKS